jgi:hypothetical protein
MALQQAISSFWSACLGSCLVVVDDLPGDFAGYSEKGPYKTQQQANRKRKTRCFRVAPCGWLQYPQCTAQRETFTLVLPPLLAQRLTALDSNLHWTLSLQIRRFCSHTKTFSQQQSPRPRPQPSTQRSRIQFASTSPAHKANYAWIPASPSTYTSSANCLISPTYMIF